MSTNKNYLHQLYNAIREYVYENSSDINRTEKYTNDGFLRQQLEFSKTPSLLSSIFTKQNAFKLQLVFENAADKENLSLRAWIKKFDWENDLVWKTKEEIGIERSFELAHNATEENFFSVFQDVIDTMGERMELKPKDVEDLFDEIDRRIKIQQANEALRHEQFFTNLPQSTPNELV